LSLRKASVQSRQCFGSDENPMVVSLNLNDQHRAHRDHDKRKQRYADGESGQIPASLWGRRGGCRLGLKWFSHGAHAARVRPVGESPIRPGLFGFGPLSAPAESASLPDEVSIRIGAQVPQCVGCGREIEPSRGNRPRKWCGDQACRKKNGARVREQAKKVAPERGEISQGLNDWLLGRRDLPAALVSAAIALAGQLDARPDDASLWRQYLATFSDLAALAGDIERDRAKYLADFRMECATAQAAEEERARRYREAMEAGDPDEARRWDALVPAGCLRGEHRLHVWPSNAVGCVDCNGWVVPPDNGLPHRLIEAPVKP
jgi:hypothetical protein